MKRWLVVSVVVAALCFPIFALAETSRDIPISPICYIHIPDIGPDETMSQQFRGDIEGLKVTYGASNSAPAGAPKGQAGTGRPQLETLIITKMTSATTAMLFDAVLKGHVLKGALISFVRPAQGPGGQEVYYTIKLEDVIIAGIHQYSDGSRLLEDVGIVAVGGKVETSSFKRDPSGRLVPFKTTTYDLSKIQ